MSTPYVGEIRLVGFNFAPPGWLQCNGSLQSIADNEVLYTLLGTTFGGDGQTTFGLPDLRGRVPVHQGQGPGLQTYIMGQLGGQATVTLTAGQVGSHSHPLAAQAGTGNSATASNAFFCALPSGTVTKPFLPTPSQATEGNMGSKVSPAGGSQPHDNMQPYLATNYIIATQGIFPSQS